MKTRLLETGLVIDNVYLDKYLDLCTNPQNTAGAVLEVHHIFPRSASKLSGQPQDDTPANLVTLDIQNHCLAHYYLTLCSKNKQFKFGNITCLNWMTHRPFEELSEDWILQNLPLLNTIRSEQRKLNSELQIGKQAGTNNGNCKYTEDQCNQVKQLLIEGTTYNKIFELTGVPAHVARFIKAGIHWSCKEDHFKVIKKVKTKDKPAVLKLKRVSKTKDSPAILKPKKPKRVSKVDVFPQAPSSWLTSEHFCKNCGSKIEVYICSKNGDGEFCSVHCTRSWAAKKKFERHPELKERILANRDYSGSKNPNYGKKASIETRQKISAALKQSIGCKNASRFAGHTHSEESKLKISNSLKIANRNKKKEV